MRRFLRYFLIALIYLNAFLMPRGDDNNEDSASERIIKFLKGICIISRPIFYALCIIYLLQGKFFNVFAYSFLWIFVIIGMT
jgi:hypothetical protein